MQSVAYKDILSMLRSLFPDKLVISLNECAAVLGVDYRTVRCMSEREKNPLPVICLKKSQKNRYGVTLPTLARWLAAEGEILTKK